MFKNELPFVLEKEVEMAYLNEMKKGDLEAKNKIIEHNLRLVYYIANKYRASLVEMDDLVSIGTIGIIKAANTFNHEKNVKFATYAARCIENEILMHLRKDKNKKKSFSIDQVLMTDKEGRSLSIADTLGGGKEEVEEDIMQKTTMDLIHIIINRLPEIEREIIKFRYGIECTRKNQQDIAKILNISQSYVSRIEDKILTKIKTEYEKAIA